MTKNNAKLGAVAPLISVSEWVQGQPTNFDQLLGRVVLLEVFQVNCPGCFLYALPKTIEFYHRFFEKGLTVIGVATAFEDFDKNTLENLRRLVETREVVGETQRMLSQHNILENGRLPYVIPFPLAMDELVKREISVNEDEIGHFIQDHVPDFDQLSAAYQNQIHQQVSNYFEKLEYRAQTFQRFNLKGTPSQILVDKLGVLRAVEFGNNADIESQIQMLLTE